MLKKIIIGIDPDVEKNGIGTILISRDENGEQSIEVELCSLPFANTLDHITSLAMKANLHGATLRVYVEAGWMERKSNHHAAQGRRAEKISKDVGANHQTGRLLIELLKHRGTTVDPVHPLRKCWKGSDRKITHAELDKIVGGLPRKRSNQEERDALLLAWVFAELPMRI